LNKHVKNLDITYIKNKKMSIATKDSRPMYFVWRVRSNHPLFSGIIKQQRQVEWRNRHLYDAGELMIEVLYKVPVLGTTGVICIDEEFKTVVFKSFDLEYGYKFYCHKLASYKARLEARHQRILSENRAYYERLAQMCQKSYQ